MRFRPRPDFVNTVKSACVDIFPAFGLRQYFTRQEPYSRPAHSGVGRPATDVANPARPGLAGGTAVIFVVVCSQEQTRTGIATPSRACQWRSGKHTDPNLRWGRVETRRSIRSGKHIHRHLWWREWRQARRLRWRTRISSSFLRTCGDQARHLARPLTHQSSNSGESVF